LRGIVRRLDNRTNYTPFLLTLKRVESEINSGRLQSFVIRALTAAAAFALLRPAPLKAQDAEPQRAPAPIFGERSFHLLHIPFLDFGPADAAAPEPGNVRWTEETAYASTFSSTWHALTFHQNFGLVGKPFTRAEADEIHSEFPEDRVFFLESDLLRVSLTGRVGLTPSLSVSAELVYVSHDAIHGGSAVESFHRAFGLTQSGRDEFPADAFYVVLQRPNGDITFDDRTPASGLGDTTATFSWRPSSRGAMRFGADAAIKAPTGSSSDYNGSGSWDGGVLAFARRDGTRWTFDGEAGWIFPGRWKNAAALDTAPFARALLAATCRLGERTWVGASTTFEQSPFHSEKLGDLAHIGGEVALGIEHRFRSSWSAGLTLTENMPSLGDRADFGLALKIRVR
jgi:Protein of unknown function (DUF3187)